MKYIPYADNVLVLLDAIEPELSPGGVWMPPVDPTPVDGRMGTVLASGPGVAYTLRAKPDRRTRPSDASPMVGRGFIPNETRTGDRVLLDSPDAGDRVAVETLLELGLDPARHYRVVREAEIAAVVEQ